jgi:glutathione peroxidase
MRSLLLVLTLALSPALANAACPPLLDHKLRALAEDRTVNLCEAYQGKVLLMVNTASKCGYTRQYDGLEKLYDKYKDRGLVVIGFPSNDFAGQEPGTEKQIQEFCRLTYGVRFPMFEKVRVVENAAHPLYRQLAKETGNYPRWNFHKYLIDRDGKVVGSYPSHVTPEDRTLVSAIERELGKTVTTP